MAYVLTKQAEPGWQWSPDFAMSDADAEVWNCHGDQLLSMRIDHQWIGDHGGFMSDMCTQSPNVAHTESSKYYSTFDGSADGLMMLPCMDYITDMVQSPEMDVATPSTSSFRSDIVDSSQSLSCSGDPNNGLDALSSIERLHSFAHDSDSLHDKQSPQQAYTQHLDTPIKQERSRNARSVAASAPPTLHLSRRSAIATASSTSSLERCGNEDDDDLEYTPRVRNSKPRSRKRQRVPHTTVERRYRENLNAHLDRLRQHVPALAPKRIPTPASDAALRDACKPSKCEILTGAIEYIIALDRENADLRTKVEDLRSRMEDLDGSF